MQIGMFLFFDATYTAEYLTPLGMFLSLFGTVCFLILLFLVMFWGAGVVRGIGKEGRIV
jgi:hypothetical protein